MTQERPPPARPWYDLVIREIALRGWTKTELSDRSGVARTTIDNWSTNRRRPSAKAVNAVADVLRIDRTEAHVLAGIVVRGKHPGQPDLMPPGLRDSIHETLGDRPEVEEAVVAAIEATLRGEPLPFAARRLRARPV